MRTVLRLTRRNLASNRLRFALTTFAVLLGVSFVVSSFVLTDGLLRTFDTIVEDANSEIDIEVSARSDFDEVQSLERPIAESLVADVVAVEGVREAEPGAQSIGIVPITAGGDAVTTSGAPILSFNWTGSIFSPLTVVEGAGPTGPGEFMIDTTTADRDDFVVGRTYQVVGVDGPERFTLVGISRFGEENALGGAVVLSFTLDELQRLNDTEGLITWISVAVEDGADRNTVIERLAAVLPGDVEAVTAEEVIAEDKDEFSGIINIFGNILLGFALVAVFVSIFIINNTFNILLGQRVRQLALLRALGASGAQVRASALLEALVIGVVASVVGLGGGVALALGLRGVMNSIGFGMPSIDIILTPRTIIFAAIVGIGVTLMAALSPARRAATVPPVAAMRVGFRFGSGEGTRRTIIAIVLATLGAAGVGYGLFGGPGGMILLVTLAGGALLVFVAVSLFAPLFSSPSASFLGSPLEHVPGRRVTGHIARENAARNNKRTASTAAGLMIGMALIAMASVTANSLKKSFSATLGSTLTADFVVTPPPSGEITPNLTSEIAALPLFDEVSAVRYGRIRVDGDGKDVAAADLALLPSLLDLDVRTGDPAANAGPGTILVAQDAASDLGIGVGDTLAVEFASAGTQTMTVGATYDNELFISLPVSYVIDLSGWDSFFDAQGDSAIIAKAASGADLDVAAASLAPLSQAFPQLSFQTGAEYREALESGLDSLVVVINVFLGLAIIIALLGITNTVALSVLERTREIGLMRAIGMTRPQTRGMIRLEAGVVSLFGALLGVVVGLVFGWVVVIAVPFIDRLSIPVVTLVVYVAVATLAGLIAASFPARRAARLNVLDAINYE